MNALQSFRLKSRSLCLIACAAFAMASAAHAAEPASQAGMRGKLMLSAYEDAAKGKELLDAQ